MRTATSAVIAALAVTVLAACGAGRTTDVGTDVGTGSPSATAGTAAPTRPAGSTPAARVTDLASARAAWAAAGIRDYDLVVGRSCFCPEAGALHVTVRAGVVVRSVVEATTDQPGRVPIAPKEGPGSVDALFGEIAARQANSYQVNVTYDQASGVPLRIYVDRIKDAVDDEIAWLVSFRPVGTTTPTTR